MCAGCIRAVDVAFLIDCSSPVDEDGSRAITTAVANLLAKFDTSDYGTHFIQFRYGNTAEMIPPLRSYNGYNIYTTAVAGCGTTGRNLGAAFRAARRNFFFQGYPSSFESKTGDRLAVPDVVVVIAGGPSTNSTEAVVEADLLKTDGIKIVTIGVGPDADVTELSAISSNITEARLFVVDEPDDVENLTPALVASICDFPVEGRLT